MTLRLDFTDQDYFRNPDSVLKRLRRAGPVVEIKFPIVGKVWLTTNYELAGRFPPYVVFRLKPGPWTR